MSCFVLLSCAGDEIDGLYKVSRSDRDPGDTYLRLKTRQFLVGDGQDLRPSILSIGICDTEWGRCYPDEDQPWLKARLQFTSDDPGDGRVQVLEYGPSLSPNLDRCYVGRWQLRLTIDGSNLKLDSKEWEATLPHESIQECLSWPGSIEGELAGVEATTLWTIEAVQIATEEVAPIHCDSLNYENSGSDFISDHCLDCHSEDKEIGDRNGSPIRVNFDTQDQIKSQSARIISRVHGASMPPRSATGNRVSFDEALAFVNWLECGSVALSRRCTALL